MSGICGVLGPGGTLGEVGRLGESGGIPALWGYLRDPGLGVLGSPGVRSGGPRDLRGLWRVLLRSGIPWMCWRVPRSPPGNGPPPPPRSGTWCVPHVGRYPWSKPRTCWAGHWAAWLRAWPATGSGAGGAGGVSPHRAPSPAQPPPPRFGRRPTFLVSLGLAVPLGLSVALAIDFVMVLVARLLFGAALAGAFLSLYVAREWGVGCCGAQQAVCCGMRAVGCCEMRDPAGCRMLQQVACCGVQDAVGC